jgi:hypothetical protein
MAGVRYRIVVPDHVWRAYWHKEGGRLPAYRKKRKGVKGSEGPGIPRSLRSIVIRDSERAHEQKKRSTSPCEDK